jgi:hypothetical protein
MAGLLVYTSTPDSDGGLGGLVRQTKPAEKFEDIFFAPVDLARVCSGDPLCREHKPRQTERLNGAACHACCMIAETSCVSSEIAFWSAAWCSACRATAERRGISISMNKTANAGLDRIVEITRALLRLSPEQLKSLARLCTQLPDSTHLTADRLQRELRVSTADAVGIARASPRSDDAGILRDVAVIATASAERESAREQFRERVDVVCTGPVQFKVPVRATFATMIEMVQEARTKIVIVGYVFTAG